MIKKMQNAALVVMDTWTYNHKLLLITLSLLVALVIQSGIINEHIPRLEADVVTYHAPVTEAQTIEMQLEDRAKELYKTNEAMDLEKYRQEAIREVNDKLILLTGESPFVDYEALKLQHGY